LQNTPELITRLADAQVEFVVIGGVAAIAWGSQQFTRDLDLAVPLTAQNVSRLMRIIRPLEPRFYQTLGKPLVTRSDEELASFKNLYFQTTLGIVDCLGEVPPLGRFEEVARGAVELELFSKKCRVISLDDLITVKHFVGRPKDQLVEAELRAVRDRLAARP
jgi:hypothetical protein